MTSAKLPPMSNTFTDAAWRRWSGLLTALFLAAVGALLSAQWQPRPTDLRAANPHSPATPLDAGLHGNPRSRGPVIDVSLPSSAVRACEGEHHVASI